MIQRSDFVFDFVPSPTPCRALEFDYGNPSQSCAKSFSAFPSRSNSIVLISIRIEPLVSKFPYAGLVARRHSLQEFGCRSADGRIYAPRTIVHRGNISGRWRRGRLDVDKNRPVRPVERNPFRRLFTFKLRTHKAEQHIVSLPLCQFLKECSRFFSGQAVRSRHIMSPYKSLGERWPAQRYHVITGRTLTESSRVEATGVRHISIPRPRDSVARRANRVVIYYYDTR